MAMAVRTSSESDREPELHETDTPITPAEQNIRKQVSSTSKPYRYKEIHVLMFLWQDDDLHVLNEVNKLKEVFEKAYNFSTHISTIPSRKPYHHVRSEIEKLQPILSRNSNLVIVYYSGHGHLFGYGKMTWSAYEKPKSKISLIPGLRWSFLQTQLEAAPADVLVLLDCCESGGSLKYSSHPLSPNITPGTTELIAASPFDTLAPGPGELSFTGALIKELEILAMREEVFSVVELHRRVLGRIIRQRTRLRNQLVKPEQWPSVSPVFVRLVGGAETPSIGLRPLQMGVCEREEWCGEEENILRVVETERKDWSPEIWDGEYAEKKVKRREALRRIMGCLKALVFKAPELATDSCWLWC